MDDWEWSYRRDDVDWEVGSPTYGRFIQDETIAEQYVADRWQSIVDSQQQTFSTHISPVIFQPDELIHGVRIGSQGGKQLRNKKGQLKDSLSNLNFDDVGKRMREMLVENYKASAIKTRTGTLLEAIEEIKPDIQALTDKFTITLELALKFREPHLYEHTEVSTLEYGAYVFNGRAGMIAAEGKKYVFTVDGHTFIAAKNIRPSRTDLDIFKLSQSQQEEILTMVKDSIGKQINKEE